MTFDFEKRDRILEEAIEWGKNKHPDASNYKHCAFANSVSYLVTGGAGGYGGPSIRQHCVTYSLAGDGYNIEGIQFPDGRIPRPGNWDVERAIAFCEPICYGNLPQIAYQIWGNEYCFDNDPTDVTLLDSADNH